MPDRAEKLFSLFASPDRAEALAGDLTEEREQHGFIWYWLHVVLITLTLWRRAATDAPLRVPALVLTGLALLFPPAFAGLAAVFLFPHAMGAPFTWIILPVFWWGGALWTGNLLVALAPRQGMAACSTLAVAGALAILVFAAPAAWRNPSNADYVFFCATALTAAIPLLVGAAAARRRML
jgi:hypothetical protein